MSSLADDDCKSETYAEDHSPALQEDILEGCGEAPEVPGSGIGDLPDKRRFELRRNVGGGAFGDVHEGFCRLTQARVAVKLARLSGVPGAERDDGESVPKGLLREIWCLRELVGVEHVTQYVAHFPRGPNIAIVLEFCATDLKSVMDVRKAPLDAPVARAWTRMALLGLCPWPASRIDRFRVDGCASPAWRGETRRPRAGEIHARALCHRDVKPSNFMITDAGVLKVGDFGQARPLVATEGENSDFSHQISTRWYRSPELLFGARSYTTAIDLWAVGVVLAEILHDYVLFEGRSDIEQLLVVFKKMGSPTAERFPSAAATPDFPKICFKAMEPLPLAEVCPRADAAALELIGTILVLEPTRRATADQALGARFFEGPDAPRVDLATLALATAAACDAKRSAAVDSDEEDWNRGGWEGLG